MTVICCCVIGLRMFETANPICKSRISPANCTPKKTRFATYPKMKPTSAWLTIATKNPPRSSAAIAGIAWKAANASTSASAKRSGGVICGALKIGMK